MTTEIHDSTTCRAGVNGTQCDMCRFADKAAQRAEHEEIVSPEPENVTDSEYGAGIGISVPTFEQEWRDAPRWVREYVEQGRLRAVLFDVIDAGCTCPTSANTQHPWKFDDKIEDFANEQRTRFVDEVIRRLQTTKTNIAQYWFIRGQFAKEVELLVTENGDLREIARVVRERLGR